MRHRDVSKLPVKGDCAVRNKFGCRGHGRCGCGMWSCGWERSKRAARVRPAGTEGWVGQRHIAPPSRFIFGGALPLAANLVAAS